MRLIDADAMEKTILDFWGCDPAYCMDLNGWDPARADVCTLERLINAPTVDAVLVVHGEWIPFEGEIGVEAFGYKEYTTLGFRCSVCHADIDVSEQYFRHCPMCGSKMDGERKGGDE